MTNTSIINIEKKNRDVERHTFTVYEKDKTTVQDVSPWSQFILTVDTIKHPTDETTNVERMIGFLETDGKDGKISFKPRGKIAVGRYFYDAQAYDGNEEIITFAEGKYKITQNISEIVMEPVFYMNNMGQINSPTVNTTKDNTRSTIATAFDHEGIVRTGLAGEIMVDGGRRGENLLMSFDNPLNSPDDMTGAYTVFATISYADNETTITAGSFSLSAVSWGKTAELPAGWFSEGQQFTMSAEIKGIGDSIGEYVYFTSNATGDIATVEPFTITGEYKRYELQRGIKTNDSGEGIKIVLKSGSATIPTGGQIKIKNLQYEEVSGRSSKVSSEYIDNTDHGYNVDNVKWFSTENGNTVINNVVTEGVGSAINPVPQVLMQPALINELTYSRDLTNAAWTETGTDVAALDKTGMDGIANSICTLTDNNGGAYEYVSCNAAIIDNSSENIFRFFVLKDSDTSRFPEFQCLLQGGTNQYTYYQLNTQTGALNMRAGVGASSAESNDLGSFWEVIVSVTNNSTGNNSSLINIYPAVAYTFGLAQSSAQGSIVVSNAEIHLNKTIDEVRGTAPVFTSGTVETRDQDVITINDLANWAPLNEAVFIAKTTAPTQDSLKGSTILVAGARHLAHFVNSAGTSLSQGGTPLVSSVIFPIIPDNEPLLMSTIISVSLGVICVGYYKPSTGLWEWDITPGEITDGHQLTADFYEMKTTNKRVQSGILMYDELPYGFDTALADVQQWVEDNAESELLRFQS